MFISTKKRSRLVIKNINKKISKEENIMKEYFKIKNMVMTQPLKNSMEQKIINCIYENIFKVGENQVLDYLQVFSFKFCEKTKTLKIIHEQEKTTNTNKFKMEYFIPNIEYSSIVNLLNEKIFCIDSLLYQTLMFASEY